MKIWKLYFNASNSEKIRQKISIFNDLWTLYPMSQFKKTMVIDFFFLLLELENVLTTLKDFTLKAYNI
jgi:hypothetical protein